MAKRLKILASVKAACRQSWQERRVIFQVSWLAILLGFLLLTLQMVLPSLKLPCQIADQVLFSVIFVCLFRKNLLDEKPALEKIGGFVFYLRFGRREALYAAWLVVLMALTWLTDQAAVLAANVPFIGSLVGSQVWPLVNFTLDCMLILVGPYIAVAPKPVIGDLPKLVEAVIGNIGNIMSAVFVIFAPYAVMTIVFPYIRGLHTVSAYAEHAVFCLCTLVEIKFVGTVYKNLYPSS